MTKTKPTGKTITDRQIHALGEFDLTARALGGDAAARQSCADAINARSPAPSTEECLAMLAADSEPSVAAMDREIRILDRRAGESYALFMFVTVGALIVALCCL